MSRPEPHDKRARDVGAHATRRRAAIGVLATILLASCTAGEPADAESGNAAAGGDVAEGQHARQDASPDDAQARHESTGYPATDDTPRMVIVPFAEAKFIPVRPDLPDSPELAVLRGDPATGPSAMLMRLRNGSIPMHLHSSDYQLVVLAGTMKHWAPGEAEETAPLLGTGSYWFQPGDLPHAEACLTEACLLHVVWAGPQDALVPQGAIAE